MRKLEDNENHRNGLLWHLVREFRFAFVAVAVFTAFVNILALSGAVFMMEVYNRVLPSRSLPTLAAFCLVMAILLVGQGFLDLLRGRLLLRVGHSVHERIRGHASAYIMMLPGEFALSQKQQSIKDLDNVRSFFSGPGPSALCDLPWMPLYLAILFAFHIYLGLVTLVGGALVLIFTLLTHLLTQRTVTAATLAATERDNLGDIFYRNAETVLALGMHHAVTKRWRERDDRLLKLTRRAGDIALAFAALARVVRLMIQSAVLAVGAYLVIKEQATGGLMLASAILATRALAPIDTAISHWRGFLSAVQSWRRLRELFMRFPSASPPMQLPAPKARLEVSNLSVIPTGGGAPVLAGIGFCLRQGQALGVLGPSGSGKSTLARALTGILPCNAGYIRLDGASVDQWEAEQRGRHIGYLPQRIDLFPGTVAENVARFDVAACPQDVIAAAQAAEMHDLILSLPAGYDTLIGPQTPLLSPGQQQRIALARALYGNPFLLVLDEPNSSLDIEGEAALGRAIRSVCARGGIVIVVSHRPSVLAAVDHLLVLLGGRMERFGPKQDGGVGRRLAAAVRS